MKQFDTDTKIKNDIELSSEKL